MLGVVATATVILAGPAMIAGTATDGLRAAGFPGADLRIVGIRVADGWTGLRFDFAGTSGALEDATAFDLPMTGSVTLSGAVVVGLETLDGERLVTVRPVECLSAAGQSLTADGQPLVLQQGASLCADRDAPLLRWSTGRMSLAVELRAPRLEAPAQALRGDSIVLRLRQEDTGTAPMRDLAATVGRVEVVSKPAPIVPLAVTIRAQQAGDSPWAVSGSAKDGGKLLAASLRGSFDPAAGAGEMEISTGPIVLAPDGPGLAALSPLAAGMVEQVSGALSGKATIAWAADGMKTGGQARVKDLAGRSGPVTFAGVAGDVTLSSLMPPVIPKGQTVAVGLLDVGIPLTDGTLRFGYGRDGRLDVDRAQWRWAGGTLGAAPFAIAPAKPRGTVTLRADGIDAAKLLALVDIDGLEATGRLGGTLPISFDGERVIVDNGLLEAVAPGTLRYDPANPPAALKGEEGSPTGLLMGALTDFHYDTLRVTIDGQAGGELRAGLSVRGSNPSFYDGHPVALNLKLSGALDRILRQNLDVYQLPDRLRDRMTGFDQKDP
nr:YdbH domain-containing protein [Azospirillum picis]